MVAIVTDPLALVERLSSEGFIGMKAAAAVAGQRHGGTVARWAMKGAKRSDGTVVKLEACRVGGRLMTSRPAVLRYLAALNPDPSAGISPTVVTAAQTKRRAIAASAELDAILGTRP